MPYDLPLSSDPRREMFDIHDLVLIGTGDVVPLDLPQSLRCAKRTFASLHGCKLVRRLNYIVMRAENDRIQLISVGRRGGWRKVWDFGPYVMPAKFRPARTVPCDCSDPTSALSAEDRADCSDCGGTGRVKAG